MKSKRIVAVAAIVLAASAITLAAETVMVSTDHVDLRSGKMSMSPVVATAKNGDALTVIDKGDVWWQVQAGDAIGWVRKADLDSASSGVHSFFSTADASANGGTAAGSLSTGGASKGLFPGAEDYAKATGTDPSKVEKLIALRKKLINDGTYAKFTAQGHVGAK